MHKLRQVIQSLNMVSTSPTASVMEAVASMTEGRSDDFRKHFMVTHFFNPVRYLHLLELVAGEHTLPEVVEKIAKAAVRKCVNS